MGLTGPSAPPWAHRRSTCTSLPTTSHATTTSTRPTQSPSNRSVSRRAHDGCTKGLQRTLAFRLHPKGLRRCPCVPSVCRARPARVVKLHLVPLHWNLHPAVGEARRGLRHPAPNGQAVPLLVANNTVEALFHMAGKVDGDAIGHNRVRMPTSSYCLDDIWAAAPVVAKEEGVALGTIKQIPADEGETTVKEIDVCPAVSSDKAEALGCPMDTDIKEIIRDYITTYVKK